MSSIVLAARSEYFRTLFASKFADSSGVIEITVEHSELASFDRLLKFVYGFPEASDFSGLDVDGVLGFLRLSDR